MKGSTIHWVFALVLGVIVIAIGSAIGGSGNEQSGKLRDILDNLIPSQVSIVGPYSMYIDGLGSPEPNTDNYFHYKDSSCMETYCYGIHSHMIESWGARSSGDLRISKISWINKNPEIIWGKLTTLNNEQTIIENEKIVSEARYAGISCLSDFVCFIATNNQDNQVRWYMIKNGNLVETPVTTTALEDQSITFLSTTYTYSIDRFNPERNLNCNRTSGRIFCDLLVTITTTINTGGSSGSFVMPGIGRYDVTELLNSGAAPRFHGVIGACTHDGKYIERPVDAIYEERRVSFEYVNGVYYIICYNSDSSNTDGTGIYKATQFSRFPLSGPIGAASIVISDLTPSAETDVTVYSYKPIDDPEREKCEYDSGAVDMFYPRISCHGNKCVTFKNGCRDLHDPLKESRLFTTETPAEINNIQDLEMIDSTYIISNLVDCAEGECYTVTYEQKIPFDWQQIRLMRVGTTQNSANLLNELLLELRYDQIFIDRVYDGVQYELAGGAFGNNKVQRGKIDKNGFIKLQCVKSGTTEGCMLALYDALIRLK